MEKQEYYLGLDMGTSSVGWAVTNTKYELLRKKERTCGESESLKKQTPQRKGGLIELIGGEDNARS